MSAMRLYNLGPGDHTIDFVVDIFAGGDPVKYGDFGLSLMQVSESCGSMFVDDQPPKAEDLAVGEREPYNTA